MYYISDTTSRNNANMASLLDSGMVVVIFITGIEKVTKKDQWLLVQVRLGRVYLFAQGRGES
jgi:hypothetical protein